MRALLFCWVLLTGVASSAWAQDMLTVAMEAADNSPYSSVAADGSFQGFHYELLNQVAEAEGFRIRWVALPWNRALKSLAQGEIMGVTFISTSDERNAYAIFKEGNVLHFGEVCLFTRPDVAAGLHWDGKISGLPNIKYGFLANYVVSSEIEKAKERLDYITVTGNYQNLADMARLRRIDAFFTASSYLETSDAAKARNKDLVKLEPCQRGDNRYIAFSKAAKDGEAWSNRFQAGLRKFRTTDAYRALLRKFDLEYLAAAARK
ncbi:MAG: transporter substrate-binding domain-containing protein [Rhodoferax sp.]|nr:transporter substrate-binding domain-containing protein [Rhodoferax sp.]